MVSFMFDEGDESKFMEHLKEGYAEWELLDGFDDMKINNYYTYYGSQTSSPCTEGVLWVIATDTEEADEWQIFHYYSKVNG
jgi:carbonic anhydrase